MCQISTVAQSIHDKLIEHLVEMEEERARVIEEYYYTKSADRLNFEKIMDNYIASIEKYIKKSKKSKKQDTTYPFVIVDSTVVVENLKTKEIERIKIVSPFIASNLFDENIATYLSPVGKSLLLKKVGDHVSIETPMENVEYVVKSIEIS